MSAEELAEGDIGQEQDHVGVGAFRRGRVPDHQQNAGDRFDDEEVGREQTQPVGMGEAGHALVIVGGFDVKQEAFAVGLEARVGAAGGFALEHAAKLAGIDAGGEAGEYVVRLGSDRAENSFFADIFLESHLDLSSPGKMNSG